MPTARFLILAATIQSVIIASEGYWSQGWQVCVTVLVWRWTALDHLSGTLPTPCLHFIFGWPLSPLLVPATHWRDWMLMPKMQPLSCILLFPHSFRESPPLLTSQLAVPQSCSPLATFPYVLSQQSWFGMDESHSAVAAPDSQHSRLATRTSTQLSPTDTYHMNANAFSRKCTVIIKIHRPCAGQCKRTTANVALHTACCAHVV